MGRLNDVVAKQAIDSGWTDTSTPAGTQQSQDFSSANRQIAMSIYKKQATDTNQGYSLVTDLATKSLNDSLEKTKYDYARKEYEQKFGAGTDTDIDKWLKGNNNRIEKDLYGMLTSTANDMGVDFDKKGGLYQGYVSDIIKKNTPVDNRNFGEKAWDVTKDIGRGMVSTAGGLYSATSDLVTGGTSYQDNYESMFGGKNQTLGKDASYGQKVWDTMWTQMGLIDVGFGIASAVSGGALAAPLAGLRATISGGLKSTGKYLLKEGVKEGTEALFKESIETAFEKSGKEVMENLFKGASHDIADLAAKEGLDTAKYMQKLSGVLKGTAIDGKVFQQGSKAEKAFINSIDNLTGRTIQAGAKTSPWAVADFVGDTLGLPTQLVKKTGKGVGLSMGGTLMTMYPALGALPGVGDFFSDTVLQTGTTAASWLAKTTESGMYAKLQKEFKDTYGMDVKDANPDVQAQFEKMASYKMKYAGVSEILTATPVSEREGNWSKIWYAGLDTLANSIVPMGGMHLMAKGYNIRQENLAPYKIGENGELISNVPFIQELHSIFENKNLSEDQRAQAISDLQSRVSDTTNSETWKNYNQNIRSIKDLKETHAQMMDFLQKIKSNEYQGNINADIYGKLYGRMSEAIESGKFDDVTQAIGEYSTELARYMQPEALKLMEEKAKLYNIYFEKLRESNSILGKLQGSALANFHLSHELDPTHAAIRGNDSLIKSIEQTMTDIRDVHETIHDVLVSEGKYIKDLKNISGDFTGIQERARNLLERSGIKASDEAVLAVANMIVPSLAKLRLSVKALGNDRLPQIFDKVFDSVGATFKTESEKSALNGLIELYITGVDKSSIRLGFEKELFEKMDGVMQGNIASKQKYSDLLESSANRLAQLTQMYSGLTSQVSSQRDVERNLETPLVREVEVTKEEAIAKLDEEIIDRKENNMDVTDLEQQKEQVQKFPDDQKVVVHEKINEKLEASAATNDLVASNIVTKDVADDADVAHKSMEVDFNERDWLIENFVPFASQVANAFNYQVGKAHVNTKYHDSNKVDINDQDHVEEKNSDSGEDAISWRNKKFDEHLENSLDIVFKDFMDNIPETFDFSQFQNLANKQLFYIKKDYERYKNMLKDKSLDDETRGAIVEKMKDLYIQGSKSIFSKQIVVDLARKANSVGEFESMLRNQLKESFGFNDKGVEKIMRNMFPEDRKDMVPYWELKRTQIESRAVQVHLVQDKDGNFTTERIIDSALPKEDEGEKWTDQYGNSRLWKQEGIATKELRDSYDVMYVDNLTYTDKDGKTFNASDFWRNGGTIEDFKKLSASMADALSQHDGGWIYLGDFQEEGKKKIFVRAKDGAEGSWNDAMHKLTGINIEEQVNSQPNFATKNQIIGNLAKYAKLIWWNETKPNKETWEGIIGNTDFKSDNLKDLQGLDEFDQLVKEVGRTAGVRTILFEDKSPALGEKLHDGRDYVATHLGSLLNFSVGNADENRVWKTATVLGEGQFIKSKSQLIGSDLFRDPYVVAGLVKASQSDPLLQKGFDFMEQNFGADWLNNQKALDTFNDLNTKFHLFDRIVPMSAYKNIFTRKAKSEGVFTEYKPGDIIEHDIGSMGLKAIDESGKNRQEEKIKISTQINRSLVAIGDMKQSEVDAINDVFTSIKKEDIETLQDLVKRIDKDPMGVVKELKEKFDADFSDYRDINFATPKGAENLEKMIKNIIKRYATTGASPRGNYIDLTYIADYENIRDVINSELVDKDNQDNWIILDDNYYGHLKNSKDANGNYIDQFMMIRYPVVGPKVITAPKIIWTSQLEAKGFPKSSIGDSVVPNHTLIKRIEGDGDGDKIFLLTDPRLTKVQNEIVKFGTQKHIEFDVDNAKANDHQETDNMQDLWLETNFDTFRGKANIGNIDNRYSEFEQLVSMGAISKDVKNTPREDLDGNIIRYADSKDIAYMSDADHLRYLYGQTLQKAVDNKKVNLTALNEKLSEYSGGYKIDEATAQQLYIKEGSAIMKQVPSIRNIWIKIGKENIRLGDIGLISKTPSKEEGDFIRSLYGKGALLVQNKERELGFKPGAVELKGIKMELNEKEIEIFNRITTNLIISDVKKANAIFKKQDFFDSEEKQEIRKEILNQDPNASEYSIEQEIRKREQKPFRDLPKEYEKAYKALKNLEAKYGEKVYNFGMMRTLRDMNGYFNQEWHNYDTGLRSTVNAALSKIIPQSISSLFDDPMIGNYNITAGITKEQLKNNFEAVTGLKGKDLDNFIFLAKKGFSSNEVEKIIDKIEKRKEKRFSKTDLEFFRYMISNKMFFEKAVDFMNLESNSEKQDYAIRKKMLSIIELDLRKGKGDFDSFLLPYFSTVDKIDKPVFNLLSPQAKGDLNEKVTGALMSLDPGSMLSNKMGSLGMDMTEYHNAKTVQEKAEALNKIFEQKYKELNLSDQEVVNMNEKVGKTMKSFVKRGGDGEALIRHLKDISDVDAEVRRENQYYVSLVTRDVVDTLGKALGLDKDLDIHKTASEIMEEKAGDVAADSYNRVKGSSISDNCN